MSDSKGEPAVKLGYDNWFEWDRYIKSTIRRKNAYVAFNPKPIDPRVQQGANPAAAPAATPASVTATTATTSTTATAPTAPTATPTTPAMATSATAPSADEVKTYCNELKEWRAADNIAAGVILGTLSPEVQHVINPEESVKSMYDKLKAEVVRQSSGSSANGTRIELIYKQFKDAPTLENFEKHLTFYRSKNASLIAVSAGFDDSFLAWLLLNSFNSNEDPVWSVASTNIVMSDTPINQWTFNHVSGKLCKAMRNSTQCPTGTSTSTSSTSQSALNTNANKTNTNHYDGPPCTHPGCRRLKSHATENCWTKEREERDKVSEKRKHKVKKAKKKAVESDSESESDSNSESGSEPAWGK